jgi:hypothetical protein
MATKQKNSSTQEKKELSIKKGRPSKYSTTLIKEVLDDIRDGQSVLKALQARRLAYSTFSTYLEKDKDIKQQYLNARECGAEHGVQKLDDKFDDYFDRLAKGEKVSLQEVKLLEIYTKHIHHMAGKVSPLYGTDKDRQRMAIQTTSGEKIVFEWGS